MAEFYYQFLIALGSNLGDRTGYLDKAIAEIRGLGRVEVVSSYFANPPSLNAKFEFLNAALILHSDHPPEILIEKLLAIESSLGRIRTERWGDRVIDLDILLVKDRHNKAIVIHTPSLPIPHREMLTRDFVLVPAKEIAQDWLHPFTLRSISEELLDLERATNLNFKDSANNPNKDLESLRN